MMSKVLTVYSLFLEGGGRYRTTVLFYLSEGLVERVYVINIGIKIELLGLFEALSG